MLVLLSPDLKDNNQEREEREKPQISFYKHDNFVLHVLELLCDSFMFVCWDILSSLDFWDAANALEKWEGKWETSQQGDDVPSDMPEIGYIVGRKVTFSSSLVVSE